MRSYDRYTVKAKTVDGKVIVGCLVVPPYEDGGLPNAYVVAIGGKIAHKVYPKSICANTGIKMHGLDAYEFDVFSFCDNDCNEGVGYIGYDAITKRYKMITNPITNETQELTYCHNIRYTGRNVKISKTDWLFVVDYARRRSVYHSEEGDKNKQSTKSVKSDQGEMS